MPRGSRKLESILMRLLKALHLATLRILPAGIQRRLLRKVLFRCSASIWSPGKLQEMLFAPWTARLAAGLE